MKRIVPILVLLLVAVLAVGPVLAENLYIRQTWWPQPNPDGTDWMENADGSLSVAVEPQSDNATYSIAYVPPGYDAIAGVSTMPGDIVLEVDLLVPDAAAVNGGWAGVYVRASQPQTGTGGYVVHINSDGLALFDGEGQYPIIEERIFAEEIKPEDWNHLKVSLVGKQLRIWINGKLAYRDDSAMSGKGYLGLTTIGYKGSFRNYRLNADGTDFESFLVPGTEWQGEHEPDETTPTPASRIPRKTPPPPSQPPRRRRLPPRDCPSGPSSSWWPSSWSGRRERVS